MTTHHRFSPSDSARWIPCPGSITLSESLELIPQDDAGGYAAEGTLAHSVGEWGLNNPTKPLTEVCDDAEMIRHVQTYVDYVSEFRAVPLWEIQVEVEVSLHSIIPDCFGHADSIVIDRVNSRVEVIDLKYGQGVGVLPNRNSQLQLYALGVLSTLDFVPEEVTLTIVQPRARDGHGAIRRWHTTPADLYKFGNKAKEAYAIAIAPNPPLCAGETQCRWCDAKPVCPALKAKVFETAVAEFEPFKTKPVELVDLAEVLPTVNLIKKWADSVLEHALGQLKHGYSIDGYKLVRGRSARAWCDQDRAKEAVVAALGEDDAFTRKLLSPTQYQKVDKAGYAEIVEELVVKPPGKLTIAVNSDSRPAEVPMAEFLEIK